MPAAAGDGLLGEPAAVAAGGEARRAAADGGSFLAAWLSAAAPRERLRDFQHTKRVGNYLIGRKLGEGSFAKVREGLHVLTGEKVPRPPGAPRGHHGGKTGGWLVCGVC
ncbi:hormonally up-regulated neu tumor-associated kinase-like [Corvus kubaryi]|uniref:hormonally up-regulated neu tumor-associated kinase-like n=1 Tax=Corvus kubaryi TaxID=68294 RepID=UPI001C04E631|nr:hormonally up-regulated neu tumor-associated kinase-like [Corvus kubaryi]XP_041900901.1 hormonally up-regulated neu tumor-associated kinase-like [Corvus kubaryi]